MKRILENSPVVGYQLFRYQDTRTDGTEVVYPNFYVRHAGKTECLKTANLKEAKGKVKKMAGEDVQGQRRLMAPSVEVRVGTLLDLVIEDYKRSGQKTIGHLKGQIKNSLRPYFGDMLAARVDTDEIDRWIRWRSARRLREVEGRESLQPASINRELSVLRRAYQLGYERRPQLVDRIPPIKKLGENNVRKGFVTPDQYRAVLAELPEYLRGITCICGSRKNRSN